MEGKCPDGFMADPKATPRAPDWHAGTALEEFRNCADIRVVGTGVGGPTASPTPSLSTTQLATSSITPTTAAPVPTTLMLEPELEPEPESELEPEPESESESEPQQESCVVTPGLNNGV